MGIGLLGIEDIGSAAAGPFVVVELAGPPRGKGRPRFGNAGDFVRVWTDKKTVKYEDALKKVALEQMAGRAPKDCAMTIQVEAGMPIPISWSRKKREAAIDGTLPCITKPDFDNIMKIIGDGLNKVVWRDDSRVIISVFHKFYALDPFLRVSVWEW